MKEMKKEQKKPSWKLVIPFFLVLAVLTVVSFIIPLRPTQSQMEKRNLAAFPEFSVDALVSGSYFDDISLWFSDTFPGREGWLTMASHTKSFHGYSEISIDGDLPMMEEIPTVPAYREEETEETLASETDETEAATEPSETEPTQPQEWGGLNAANDADILFSDTVIQIGDSVFGALGFSQVNSDRYIKAVNKLADLVAEDGATVVHAPPPTAVGILVQEEYQKKLRSSSQSDTLKYLHDGMSDKIVKVDTVSALLEHNDEYVYFRTDHHWTALGAYYSYRAVCEAIGMEPVDIETMEVWDQGEFIGSLYGRASRPRQLKKDNVYAYIPKGDIVNRVHDSIYSDGMEYPLLADTTKRNKDCKYLTFGTDWKMNHVENRSLPDAPNCLVVKDSFGNCFVPFLTQNFNNVYAVDYRKFREITLSTFVEKYDIDYVIMMPYLTATQSIDGSKTLEGICY